jgi:MOSC domain-containing protein YiiM
MQLTHVNIATPQPIRAKSGHTGIYKLPQDGPIRVTPLGLEGDAIVDTESHGGFDQAVYVFGTPDLDWWSAELGRTLEPGNTFGENLTISDLESATYHAGDRLRAGDVVLEVTSPRVPCVTLAARMGDPKFVKRFVAAERFGLYCRVLEGGFVRAGAAVELERFEGETISALEMFRLFYSREYDPAVLRRALQAPIHRGMRGEYEGLLARR